MTKKKSQKEDDVASELKPDTFLASGDDDVQMLERRTRAAPPSMALHKSADELERYIRANNSNGAKSADELQRYIRANAHMGLLEAGAPPLRLVRRGTGATSVVSQPGAYAVAPPGSSVGNNTEDDTVMEDLDGLELAEHPQHQQENLEESGLPQAWPCSHNRPVATATATLEKQEENEVSQWILTGKRKKLMVVGILAVAAAILASSIAMPIMFASDPKKSLHLQTKSTIMDAFGKEYFDNPQKEKALHWIVYEDPRNAISVKEEDRKETNLIQRFSLVSFYFQTSAQQPWKICSPPTGKQRDTCYYPQTWLASSKDFIGTRWLTAANECQWMGVTCARGTKHVTELSIYSSSLSGTIPVDEVLMLTQLKILRLDRNRLTGSIPTRVFDSTTQLEIISLLLNKLTGSIPSQAFSVPSLTALKLVGNQLHGSIPTQIGLFNGKHLWLNENLLTGTIPEDLGTANVQSLHLQGNMVTGTLPSVIGSLTELKEFHVSDTLIEGTIPSQLGLLHKIIFLAMERIGLGGTIPEELYGNEEYLDGLFFSGCNLTGTISTRIGQLKSLESFHIANNNLHGRIPTQLSLATKLRKMHLQGNADLRGSIPNELCSRLRQKSNIMADCTPGMSTGIPTVYCPKHCCSICCDAETKICMDQ